MNKREKARSKVLERVVKKIPGAVWVDFPITPKRRLDVETLLRWKHEGAVNPRARLAIFSAEWQHLIDLAILGSKALK